MVKINYKQYGLYLLRWQASTPILAIVLVWLSTANQWVATVIANLIGGLIFFWVDKFIFTSPALEASWEVKDNVRCTDCHKLARGYRLVKTPTYNRLKDPHPEYRCESCSKKKSRQLRRIGVTH